ncbi:MAG: Hsp20 family protein [Bosea sp. (in: a-proteobacteria)]
MRTFDLTPFQRSTIGFDRLFSMLDQATGVEPTPAYPPYNIERTGENAYRITIAVAGFRDEDIAIETRENTLVVRGERKSVETEATLQMLHQGIAARAFERRFQLADNVHATGASLEHGLLSVDLVHEIPEAKKPRLIPIGGKTATIDASAEIKAEAKSDLNSKPRKAA